MFLILYNINGWRFSSATKVDGCIHTLSIMLNIVAADPLAKANASKYGAVWPMYIDAEITLKNTCEEIATIISNLFAKESM